jgi:Spy/CpxP family protein refolding chaperone
MKHSILNATAVTALAAAMAFGQNAPADPPAHQGRGGRGAMMGRFGADLNLTDAQKQQMQSIFSASRESARALNTQLKQNRDALAAAVKAGASDAEIDRLSGSLAPLLAQSTANHAKTFAKFYSILTQEQKDKIGDRFNGMMFGMQGGPRGQGGPARSRRQ